MSRPRATARLFVAAALLSGWMVLLFSGLVLGGAVHLLLLGSLVAFPWRVGASGRG